MKTVMVLLSILGLSLVNTTAVAESYVVPEGFFGYEEVPILDDETTRIAPEDFVLYEETPTYEEAGSEQAEFAAFETIGVPQE